jgi:hypothetical protein
MFTLRDARSSGLIVVTGQFWKHHDHRTVACRQRASARHARDSVLSRLLTSGTVGAEHGPPVVAAGRAAAWLRFGVDQADLESAALAIGDQHHRSVTTRAPPHRARTAGEARRY